MAQDQPIGKITHFYSHLGVGIIALTAPLKVGDSIHVKGHTTDFTQTADSLQLNHQDVSAGKKGDEIGVKLDQKVRHGDTVFLV
jgi:hypothetical protein